MAAHSHSRSTAGRRTKHDKVTLEILNGLASDDPYDQYFAIMSIDDLERPDLVPHLVPLLESPYADIRVMAIATIGENAKRAKPGVDHWASLIEPMLFHQSDVDVRYEAADVLGRLGLMRSVEVLCQAGAEDPDEEVRACAAKSARLITGQLEPGDEFEEVQMFVFDPFRLADQPMLQ